MTAVIGTPGKYRLGQPESLTRSKREDDRTAFGPRPHFTSDVVSMQEYSFGSTKTKDSLSEDKSRRQVIDRSPAADRSRLPDFLRQRSPSRRMYFFLMWANLIYPISSQSSASQICMKNNSSVRHDIATAYGQERSLTYMNFETRRGASKMQFAGNLRFVSKPGMQGGCRIEREVYNYIQNSLLTFIKRGTSWNS